MQPNHDGQKVVIFQGYTNNSYGGQSELDLDLYETDEVPDSPNEQQLQPVAMSLSGLPSILGRDSVAADIAPPRYARAAPTRDHKPSDVSSQNRTQPLDTSSSGGGSSSTRRLYGNRPMNPHPTIRTNFMSATNGGRISGGGNTSPGGGATPKFADNAYENVRTPPSEPAFTPPEELGVHPAFAKPMRTELSMRAEWTIGLVIVGIGLGIAIGSQKPNDQFAYWLTTIGDLYVRMTACVTLPLAFCQVVTCSAELLNNDKLRRAWRYTALYFVLVSFLSSCLGVAVAAVFQPLFQRHEDRNYRLPHPQFAVKCADGHYMELQSAGNLACTGSAVSKNTTFPRLLDATQRLGLEEAVGNVNVSGYVFAMIEVFFPQNLMKALTIDKYLSALIVAAVLGVAIGKSYTCAAGEIRRSRNPLFRLFTHIYLSLFAMSEWVQVFALWATVPILLGAALTMPNVADTLSLTRYYIAAMLLSVLGQCLVIVPIIFYIAVRQNPYRWLGKMLSPISYGMVFQDPFLSLSMATKAALRSNEISPCVFGGVYPILTALNRSYFSSSTPTALVYVAAFSGCTIEMNASNALLMFGVTSLGSFGDTMLPRTVIAYFLMTWRTFCQNEDLPSSALMLTTIGILVDRLATCVGNATNLLLIRIVAHFVDREDVKMQQQLDEAFRRRDSASVDPSPLASPPSSQRA
jgi:Na+/H+-dicarboxylate symporter